MDGNMENVVGMNRKRKDEMEGKCFSFFFAWMYTEVSLLSFATKGLELLSFSSLK